MNRMFYGLVLVSLFFVLGCGQQPQEEAISEEMEPADSLIQEGVGASVTEVKPLAQTAQQPVAAAAQQATERPSSINEIQQALKNAGLYQGAIDGKMGPMTREAIETFQANNALEVDGKVGPRTWEKLKAYLNAATPSD